MPITVTMLQTRQGEGGSLWNAGSSYSASDAFATYLITSNLATGTIPAVPPTSLSPAQVTATAALVSGGGIPRGSAWITDTIHGFDLYKYIPQRPTLYFDPSATSSSNRGTFYQPYNTLAALLSVIQGDMRGQILGFKRATTLSLTGANGLQLAPYGTSTDPFWMVPYGDADALPIITGGSVLTDWTVTTGQEANNIWQRTMTQADVWENSSRLQAKTWSSNIATTALAVGQTTYNGGVLYVRPSDGSSPNLGQMTCAVTDYALNLEHCNVSSSGYVNVCGLHIHTARNNVFMVSSGASTTNITTVAGVNVMGCKVGRAGTDKSGLGNDAITVYGAYNAGVKWLTGSRIVGNYCYDSLNNAVEISGCDGIVIELNQSYRCEGHSIVEMWSENKNNIARYNYGVGYFPPTRIFGASQSGVWFANHCYSAGWDGDDATNLLNANNQAYFNIIDTPGAYFLSLSGGTGHKVYHNTCYWNPASVTTTTGQGGYRVFAATTTAAAQGFADISNNLFMWGSATSNGAAATISGTLGTTAQVPSSNNNYFGHLKSTGASLNWVTSAGTQNAIATFRTQLTGAGYAATAELNSDVTGAAGGSTLTTANIGFRPATYQVAPIGATVTKTLLGLTNLTAIGNRRYDGTPYDPATCVSGALLRASGTLPP